MNMWLFSTCDLLSAKFQTTRHEESSACAEIAGAERVGIKWANMLQSKCLLYTDVSSKLSQSDIETKCSFCLFYSIARKHHNVVGVGRVKCYCAVNYVCAIYIFTLTIMIALTAVTFIANFPKKKFSWSQKMWQIFANRRAREREKDSDR